MREIEVRKLDRAKLADRQSLFQYESDSHYRVNIVEKPDGWTIELSKEKFPEKFVKRETEHVVTHYKGDSEIYGASVGGEEVGFIQLELQEWNRSVRVWDIDVLPEHRRSGVGTALMERCKARARELGARRIILETQTSNLKAIDFYRKQGFKLAGLDTGCYHNDDIGRCEVRLEFAFALD